MITTNYQKKKNFFLLTSKMWGFPGGSVVKTPPANAGDMGSTPGLVRSSEEGNDNLLQYSCLGNPKLKEPGEATVHGVTKELDMT